MMNEMNLATIMGNKTIFAFEIGEHRKCIAHGETRPRTHDFRLIPVF